MEVSLKVKGKDLLDFVKSHVKGIKVDYYNSNNDCYYGWVVGLDNVGDYFKLIKDYKLKIDQYNTLNLVSDWRDVKKGY